MKWYLAGRIDMDLEFDDTWRGLVKRALEAMGHEIIYPCDNKKSYFQGLLEAGEYKQHAEEIREVVLDDVSRVDEADGLIAFIENYSVGTSAEIFRAWMYWTPVLVVTPIPRAKVNDWLNGMAKEFFGSFDELEHWMAEHYGSDNTE